MKKQHRRPDVEALESMTLLSGIAGEAHAAALAALTVKVSLPNPLPLIGSVHGSVHGGPFSAVAKGSGSFAGIGNVTFKLSDQVPFAAPVTDFGSITISSKELGMLFVDFYSFDGETDHYQITHGTKAFANETGSGTFVYSYSKPGEVTLNFN